MDALFVNNVLGFFFLMLLGTHRTISTVTNPLNNSGAGDYSGMQMSSPYKRSGLMSLVFGLSKHSTVTIIEVTESDELNKWKFRGEENKHLKSSLKQEKKC